LDFIEIPANLRSTTGNGPARVLRREGRIPAVLYGPGVEPVSLSVPMAELELVMKAAAGQQVLCNLTIDGGQPPQRKAMIKEIQSDPVSGRFLHVDFYEISMDRKIRVKVPVVTTGKSKGVEFGGMLQVIRRELEILCLPNEIPESVVIDITEMEIGDSVHVEDVSLAEGIEIPFDVNFTILTVLGAKKEEVEEEELEEGEEGEVAEAAEAEAGAEE
jgi:large subunit ribosomal protein L25